MGANKAGNQWVRMLHNEWVEIAHAEEFSENISVLVNNGAFIY